LTFNSENQADSALAAPQFALTFASAAVAITTLIKSRDFGRARVYNLVSTLSITEDEVICFLSVVSGVMAVLGSLACLVALFVHFYQYCRREERLTIGGVAARTILFLPAFLLLAVSVLLAVLT